MRKNNLIISLITLLFTDIVYFVWMPYPKSFLKTAGSRTFVFDFITNTIFFAAFAVILLVSINSITKPGRKLPMRKILISIVVVIGVQLGLDVLKFVAEQLLRLWSPLSNDFFTVFGMFILVYTVRKLLQIKLVNWKRFYAIFLLFAGTALTVFSILDIQSILAVTDASGKYIYFPEASGATSVLDYLDPSSVLNDIGMNAQFLYEIRNGALDVITGIVIMGALYSSVSSKNIENDEEYHTKTAYLFSRFVAVLLLCFTICGLKALILPQNVLCFLNGNGNKSHKEGFSLSDRTITIDRALNYQYGEQVYCRSYFKLCYDNKKIAKFYMDGKYASQNYSTQGNMIYVEDTWQKIDVNDTEVIICYDKIIAYLKNESPYVITFHDIEDAEFDEILFGTCKKLLEEGRIDCFEYISDYVGEYDPDFIKPYLERYSSGNFTEAEFHQMGDINPDYITRCAKQFSNQ